MSFIFSHFTPKTICSIADAGVLIGPADQNYGQDFALFVLRHILSKNQIKDG